MLCPTCQTNNAEGVAFCVDCGTRLEAPAPAARPDVGALPQQTILQDRYVITQKLGQGGMGAVYRASDRRLSTVSWAIKEMIEPGVASPEDIRRARDAFRHEAEMLAALSHQNLPRVTDHFEQGGKAYLVMEFVPGETLLGVLRRDGLPQPQARVFEWARQLCDALEYLHAQNPPIIFRDLKPANIMLTPQGQIKLIDFGIARLFKPGQAKDTQAFGTVGYSAPEQYGQGQTDQRSDVYSLGVLMHQLLTGYDPTLTPFRLPPAGQINPSLPGHLTAVLAAATDTDPSRRFPSVRAFREALLGPPSQPVAPPASQPLAPGQGGAVYARPASQPYPQPGSQPFGAAQSQTTGLANSSRWIGVASGGAMLLALLLILSAGGKTDGGLGAMGTVLAFPALIGSVIALTLGIIALVRPNTIATTSGRRHAIIGIAAGSVALLFCCMTLALIGDANGSPRSQGDPGPSAHRVTRGL